MSVYATPALVKAIRQQGDDVKVNDAVKVDSVLYLGDEGGVACAIRLPGTKSVVVASLTHLRIDSAHPLAGQIEAYQLRRSQKLEGRESRGSGKSQGGLATKPKRKGARVKKKDVRARFNSACDLWQVGQYEKAADAFREVLALDPDDPHFARYWLASSLFQVSGSQELDKVLQQQDDRSGIWRFAQALQAFRLHGDSEDAQRLLVAGDHLEPGFEHYLLRDKVVDASRPVRFDADQDERAFGCARLFLPAWRAVPGAAAWARRVLKVPPTSADPNEVQRRFPRAELRALPARRETWQVGLRHKQGEEPPVWLLGVANVDGQEVRAMTVIDQPLNETIVWNHLIPCFLSPMDGKPARPATLVVCRPELCDAWGPLLSDIGVRCQYENDPQPIGQILEAMAGMLEKSALPPAEGIDIREFPQSDAVWQADFIRSPAWVMNEEEGSYRPWTVLIVDKSLSIALATSHAPGDPAPEVLLEFLIRTMARPNGASAQRPRLVEVADSDCYDYLRPRLEAAGVACQLVDEMGELNDFCVDLARGIDGSEKCALADGQDVTRAHMESFYEAAEYYFRQAPWRHVPGEVPIEVRCSDPRMGTRFAIVMGRTGVQMGLAVYDDWQITRKMLSGYATAEDSRALVVCYDEAQIMSAVDLQLIERLGWPIATPEAWPAVMRLKPQHTPSSPSADELVFLDACLRAIPDFIQANAASQTRKVQTGTRSVELQLAWKQH
jgi:hypothetical protein